MGEFDGIIKLLEAIHGPRTPEQIEESKARWKARKELEAQKRAATKSRHTELRKRDPLTVCRKCQRELAPTEPIAVNNPWWGKTEFICQPCIQQTYKFQVDAGFELPKHEINVPCPECGRTMLYKKDRSEGMECSYKCRYRQTIKRQCEKRRVDHELVECAICGEEFEQTRSDAKFCSNRCRQQAHRNRKHNGPP